MFLFSCSVRHLQTHSSCLTIPPWPGEFSIAIRNDSRDVRRFFDSKHKVSILGVYFACEFVRLWRWAYICEWVCVFIDPFVLCIFKWRTGTCCSISVLRKNMIRRNSRGVHRSVYLYNTASLPPSPTLFSLRCTSTPVENSSSWLPCTMQCTSLR